MPIYEYACENCKKVTEALRKMADADAELVCEHCGSTKTHRQHSVFSASAGGGQDVSLPMGGGCCPCGDPNGPCNIG